MNGEKVIGSMEKERNGLNNITNIIPSVLEWAKNNDIYINPKLTLNRRLNRDNYYAFYADSKIPNNTLLLRVPYNMMITQKNLYDIHKTLKNNTHYLNIHMELLDKYILDSYNL